jgi:integrase
MLRSFPILFILHATVGDVFRNICIKTSVVATPSLLLPSGVGMKEVQEWLGHSDYATTANIHSHLEYNPKVSSAQAMSGVPKLK